MTYEKRWADLKAYVKALIRSIEMSIEHMDMASYGVLTGDLQKAFRESVALENAKNTLRIVNTILWQMEEMEARE